MKKLIAVLLFSFVAVFAQSEAAGKSMGIGGWAQAGNPGERFGLDFELRQGDLITVDIYLHFYFSSGDNSLGGYVGYYWNYYFAGVPGKLGRMGVYGGPAGGLGWWGESYSGWDYGGLAIRFGVVGGYQWEFPVMPLQLYLELNPVGEFHYLWWDEDYVGHDDSDVEWEIPDFYFRIGLRFWF